MDVVVALGEDDNDLVIIDMICRQFEGMSGAILNRSHKTAILGLGAWAGCGSWSVQCVYSPSSLKIFGVTCPYPGRHHVTLLEGLPYGGAGLHLWLAGQENSTPAAAERHL